MRQKQLPQGHPSAWISLSSLRRRRDDTEAMTRPRASCEKRAVHGLIEVEYQTRTNNAVPYKTALGAMCLFNVVPPCFRVTCCSSSYSRDFRRSWGGRSTFLYFTECIRFLHVAQRTTRTQFSMLVVLESSLCFSCPSRSVNFDLFQDLACTAV